MNPLVQRNFLLALVLALIAAGCGRQTEIIPPEIHYGFDTCTDCGMIIAESHYAAALAWRTTPEGTVQNSAFDDIGCLLSWRRHHADVQVVAVWVKDVRTADWLNAIAASYVRSRLLHTPMGSGVVAGMQKNDFADLPVQQPMLPWTALLNAGRPEAGATAPTSFNGHDD